MMFHRNETVQLSVGGVEEISKCAEEKIMKSVGITASTID